MSYEWLISTISIPFHCEKYLRLEMLLYYSNWTELRRVFREYSESEDKVWSEGFVLINSAVERRDPRLVKMLIVLYSSLSFVVANNNGFLLLQFILYYAIVSKYKLLIDQLVYVGVNVNDPLEGDTALNVAIRSSAGLDIIKSIIDHGACVKGKGNNHSITPLGLIFLRFPTDLDVAELLLTHGADVNNLYHPDSTLRPLIHVACALNNNVGLKWLLDHKADPNMQAGEEFDAETGLHITVRRSDVVNTTTLLEYGASPNIVNSRQQTPLYIAVEKNNAEITELLLLSGADICNTSITKAFRDNVIANSEKSSGSSAQHKILAILAKYRFVYLANIYDHTFIHAAARNGHFFIITKHLEAGASPNSVLSNTSLLLDAIKSKNKDLVDILLSYGSATTYKDENGVQVSAVEASVSSDDVDITELLLSKGQNNPSQFCINLAAENLNLDMLTVLLNFGDSVNLKYKHNMISPIQSAILSNKHDCALTVEDIDLEKSKVVRFLLKHGASILPWKKVGPYVHPIHFAISSNYMQVVIALLEAGTSFDYVVDDERMLSSTLLHYAVPFNSSEMLNVLLEKGASVDALQYDGKTPLDLAIESLARNAVRVLLENGASVGNKDLVVGAVDKGCTAEIVSELLEFGADVNCKSWFAMTALHKACLLGKGDVVAALLNHGADINAVDLAKNTPFMQLKKTKLAMKIVAQGNWFAYEHGEAIAGPSTPLYHLQRQAYKMDLLGLSLHPCFKPVLELECCKNLVVSCKKEIETMKTSRIGTSFLCVYSIIKQKHDPAYLTNKEVLLSLNGSGQLENFPLFHGILKYCIKRAELRNKLLDSGQKYFSNVILFSHLKMLSNEIIRKIMSNLTDEELQISSCYCN